MKYWFLASGAVCVLFVGGCAHKKQRANVPPPPTLPPASAKAIPEARHKTSKPRPGVPAIPASEKPLYTEFGVASWYGPPYHNRRAANGEVYDMNAMTAAHRTLPLNSVVRVTNVKTGNSAVLRITDRGPFVGQRMLDLSLAAAKAVDVWLPGTAWVRMDVLSTPVPLDTGGRWAVQIGAFSSIQAATRMKESVQRDYRSANVLEFAGPTGEWVRVRVQDDDREMAEQMSRSLTTPEGGVYLVRLD
jgi:rare lipoprotein A